MPGCIPTVTVLLLGVLATVGAGETVQFDVRPVLDGRSVTTLSPGASGPAIVTWNAEVGRGATGGCGYMTRAAWDSVNAGGRKATALPDDGVFPATDRLPRVVLNYGNADGTSPQTRTVRGAGEFAFTVPPRSYQKVFIFLSAAPVLWTDIVVTAVYQDGGERSVATKVPEFSLRVQRPLADPAWSVLASDIGKWDASNACRESGKHFIDALDIGVDPARVLLRIRISSRPGSSDANLTFWGATGITAAGP